MNHNHRATPLVTFTIVVLAIYVPIETLYSLPALWDPFYLVDLIGMIVLGWGVVRCRREATPGNLAILAAGYAWEGANFWRALFGRIEEIAGGGQLDLGWAELCFCICMTLAAIVGAVWSARLAQWRDAFG